MIFSANDRLEKVRERMPDAGGLVIANDISMAKYMAKIISREIILAIYLAILISLAITRPPASGIRSLTFSNLSFAEKIILAGYDFGSGKPFFR